MRIVYDDLAEFAEIQGVEFGKNVFRDRKEAEKALKGGESDA